MRNLIPAALLFSASLVASASASADTSAAAPPVAAPPPAAAPVLTAPPAAPAYPAPLAYAPGYPPPYWIYPPSGAGAPPPYWTPIAPPTERRSPALRNTGIVLFGVGGAVTVVGAVMFFSALANPCVVFDTLDGGQPAGGLEASHERVRSAHQALSACDTDPVLGLGLMGVGLATAVVGIPLFVIGTKQVPARTTTGKLVPELSVGAGNGSLRWTF
jgi:hypothetical protein